MKRIYSQLYPLRRTPWGPALAVRLMESRGIVTTVIFKLNLFAMYTRLAVYLVRDSGNWSIVPDKCGYFLIVQSNVHDFVV